MDKKRNMELDIIKGICIIFMVLGHTSWEHIGFFTLFHMSCFFMISGYLFNENNAISINTIKQFVIKRFKRLYIPWVGTHTVYLFLSNLFIKIGFYTDDIAFLTDSVVKHNFGIIERMGLYKFLLDEIKILLMGGGTQFGGSLWFLRSLLLVECIYVFIIYISKKLEKRGIVSIAVLILFICGRILSYISFGAADIIRIVAIQVLIPISAYYFGSLFKKYSVYIMNAYSITGILVSIGILITMYICRIHIDMSNGQMTSITLYIIATLLGFVFCMGVAKQIIRVRPLKSILSYIGRHTMPILILHLLAFKIVTFVQIKLYGSILGLPYYAMASFPTLISSGMWPFVYTFIGVLVPLLLNSVYLKMVYLCKKR